MKIIQQSLLLKDFSSIFHKNSIIIFMVKKISFYFIFYL